MLRSHFHLRFIICFSFCLLLIASLSLKSSLKAHSQEPVLHNASEDEIIVKYKSFAPSDEKVNLRKISKTILKSSNPKLHTEVLKLQDGTVAQKINLFKKNPFVQYAEPNFKTMAFSITNDTSLNMQWGLFKIDAANQIAQSAWDITPGDPLVKIAILDTGIEATHSDLTGKVVNSANFTTSPSTNDLNGHGTHVAGIAAAATNNGTGVAGTGYNTVLLNGKVLSDSGSGYYSWLANGIVWAADQGAKVISISLGGTSSSQALEDAVNYAWNKGAIVVAAAGNSNNSTPNYPGYYTNVIAVAATDSTDSRASFSNYGNWVDVAAPGVSIYSTYKGNSYATLSGTSMATPFTSGTAALVWANGNCTTNVCVRDKIEQTADKIPGTGTLWSSGRINAYQAVYGPILTLTPTPDPSETITPSTTPISTQTPTPLPTQLPSLTPTPAKTMTVSSIVMTSSPFISSTKRITSTIAVIAEQNLTPLSSVNIKGNITTPSGAISTFSANTSTSGKVSIIFYSKEKGTFTTTITNLSKSSYTYHPTQTTSNLIVQ